MVEAGKFVDRLEATDVEFFAGVSVKVPGECDRMDKGVFTNDCINVLYQKTLLVPKLDNNGKAI